MKFITKAALTVLSGLLVSGSSVYAQSGNDVEISLRKSDVTGTSRCYNITLRNNNLEKIQLNVFGSFILSDSDGAQANFDIMGTTQKNPAFPVNETVLKGDAVSGWLCWKAPESGWKAVNLDIKVLYGPRVARLKL